MEPTPTHASTAGLSLPTSRAHATFLTARQAALRSLGAAVGAQVAALREAAGPTRPLFGPRDIQEFALGSVAACFGPDYAVYDRRRCPRTPNGDLMLISRVMAVEGRRGELTPGSWLEAEYDLPAEPWFAADPQGADIPWAILMELALQPCGFLSAYLDPTYRLPPEDWYFRNLDGCATLIAEPELRGRTLACRATLRSSITLAGTIVQSFGFELASDGSTFYRGEAVFGYFRATALASQVGLDGGRVMPSWYDQMTAAGALEPCPARPPHAGGDERLRLLDEVVVVPNGGLHGKGYAAARKEVDPASWFFACHFYQDPVMPGSLGVEAILQALEACARELEPACSWRGWRSRPAVGHQMRWKYRGQLVPGERELRLEVHLKDVQPSARRLRVAGDASLWKGPWRIYEVRDAAIELSDG